MNEQNLIPFNAMPPEQHRELSARGGRISGERRREKAAKRKAVREATERYVAIEGFVDDIEEFKRWKKRRDKARANRERTTRE